MKDYFNKFGEINELVAIEMPEENEDYEKLPEGYLDMVVDHSIED